jgi:hypothetical protein
MLVKIKAESKSAKSRLEKDYSKYSLLDPVLREEGDQIRERACKIVGVHSHKLAAKRAREGIKKAVCISVNEVSESLKKVHVLRVKVKNQRSAVSKGVKCARKIYGEHQYNGNEEAECKVCRGAQIKLLLKILQKALGMKTALALAGKKREICRIIHLFRPPLSL